MGFKTVCLHCNQAKRVINSCVEGPFPASSCVDYLLPAMGKGLHLLHSLCTCSPWLPGGYEGRSRGCPSRAQALNCRTFLLHSSADTSLCSPSGESVGTPPPPKVWSSPIGLVPVVTSHTTVIPGETVCHGNPSRKPPEWQAAVYLWVQGPCSFTVSIPWPRGHRSRPPQLMRALGPGHRLSQAG